VWYTLSAGNKAAYSSYSGYTLYSLDRRKMMGRYNIRVVCIRRLRYSQHTAKLTRILLKSHHENIHSVSVITLEYTSPTRQLIC